MSAPLLPPAPAHHTVLVVVAEPALRERLSLHLRAAGCFPLEAATADEGRRLASYVLPDLVVLDGQGLPSAVAAPAGLLTPAPGAVAAAPGRLEIDPGRPVLRLRRAGGWVEVDLPRTEYRLLACLLAEPGRARSRQEILEAVWAGGPVGLRSVDQYVRRLRRSLAKAGLPGLVTTVNGLGYRLDLAAMGPAPG